MPPPFPLLPRYAPSRVVGWPVACRHPSAVSNRLELEASTTGTHCTPVSRMDR